jgi:hypothetical protein
VVEQPWAEPDPARAVRDAEEHLAATRRCSVDVFSHDVIS